MKPAQRNRQGIFLLALLAFVASAAAAEKPVKVFILAGDENCLEQGVIAGRTDGMEVKIYPTVEPEKDEQFKHVTCAVYKGAFAPNTDYDKRTPAATEAIK